MHSTLLPHTTPTWPCRRESYDPAHTVPGCDLCSLLCCPEKSRVPGAPFIQDRPAHIVQMTSSLQEPSLYSEVFASSLFSS